jgi:hypothetical protein
MVDDVSIREFGSALPDLELDFDGGSRPHLTTRVITGCTSVDETSAWKMTVGRRIELLLMVAALRAEGALAIGVRCASCGEISEVELTIEEVLSLSSKNPAPVELDGRSIELRHPTGADQLAWLEARPASNREATLLAVRSLIDGDWNPAAIAEIERSLDESDPLVNFQVAAICPECGVEGRYPVDWTDFAFSKFRQAQREQIGVVHRLARCYHWSESEIFAVPAWRRRLYLDAVDRSDA